MPRALKADLVEKDGVICLNREPFTGIAFDDDGARNVIAVTFRDVTLKCWPIKYVESYQDGRRGELRASRF